jgi:nitroreductase
MQRRTTSEPVSQRQVDELLDLARRAPSAGNAQAVDLVVVADPHRRAAIADLADEASYVERGLPPWLSLAPVHVVPCADVRRYRARYAEPDKGGAGVDGWSVPYWWMDLGAVVQNLLLLATEAGLAAGFLGEHAIPGLARALALPADVLPAGVVTLGWPHEEGPPPTTSESRPRRDLDEVRHREVW